MNNDLRSEIESTFKKLNDTVSAYDQEQINIVPFEGSWTAGQVAQHLMLSGSNIGSVLDAPVKDAERKPDEMIEKLRDIFLNFNTKLDSPDFICPEKKDYNKEEILKTFDKIKGEILNAIDKGELEKLCLSFEFPGIGHLTRLEIINFINFHTKRHTRQIENIYKKLEEK